MRISNHPEIQQDPNKRPNVIRIAIQIYQPVWTGEPCNWGILLGTEDDATLLYLADLDSDPRYALRYHPSKIRDFVDCGAIPSFHYFLALDLIDSCAMSLMNRVDPHFWVFSSLILLSMQCGMNVVPAVDEVLRCKRGERPTGFMNQYGYRKPGSHCPFHT